MAAEAVADEPWEKTGDREQLEKKEKEEEEG
jgi:hypothetical protein